jgi:hypothetical protein
MLIVRRAVGRRTDAVQCWVVGVVDDHAPIMIDIFESNPPRTTLLPKINFCRYEKRVERPDLLLSLRRSNVV